MMKKTALALLFMAATPFAASAADGISYNYIQGGYTSIDGDGNADADGWGLDGSVAISPNFHLFAGYNSVETDFNSPFIGDFDIDQWRFGVGYNYEISQNADLLAKVAYEKFDAGRGADYDGFSVEAGIRGSMLPQLEGYALAGYERFDLDNDDRIRDDDGDFYGRLGAQYKFNQNWGIDANVKFSGDDRQWFVGPRFTFN